MKEGDDSSSSESECDTAPPPQDLKPEELLADTSFFTRYIKSGMGVNLDELPLRYLAPGSVSDLHRDFQAAGGQVSFTTFNRCWKEFASVLRFRSKGDFAECDYCADYKQAIKEAKKEGHIQLLEALRQLQEHYHHVAMSRQLEETLRSSPPNLANPVLAVLTDGMDQSHWSLPRVKGWSGAKRLSSPSCKRPRLKVQGVWVFYFGCHMFLADSCQPHDSSMVCECLARALEHIQTVAKRRSLPVPTELAVVADNTVREAKNCCMILFLAALQSRGMFQTTSLVNHLKGHTHNILDQMFGVLSRQMQFIDFLPDIYAVAHEIKKMLSRPSLAKFLAGAEPVVEVLESVRDWQAYLKELNISIGGGLNRDVTANHTFLFVYRALFELR